QFRLERSRFRFRDISRVNRIRGRAGRDCSDRLGSGTERAPKLSTGCHVDSRCDPFCSLPADAQAHRSPGIAGGYFDDRAVSGRATDFRPTRTSDDTPNGRIADPWPGSLEKRGYWRTYHRSVAISLPPGEHTASLSGPG